MAIPGQLRECVSGVATYDGLVTALRLRVCLLEKGDPKLRGVFVAGVEGYLQGCVEGVCLLLLCRLDRVRVLRIKWEREKIRSCAQ